MQLQNEQSCSDFSRRQSFNISSTICHLYVYQMNKQCRIHAGSIYQGKQLGQCILCKHLVGKERISPVRDIIVAFTFVYNMCILHYFCPNFSLKMNLVSYYLCSGKRKVKIISISHKICSSFRIVQKMSLNILLSLNES